MTMSSSRVVEVAGQKVLTVSERVPKYRSELIRALIAVIQLQREGLSDKGRRDKVGKVVEGLGSRVAHELGEV